MTFPLLPDQASLGAGEVDHLMLWLLGVTVFFLLVTAGPILVFCFRYRRGSKVNRRLGNASGFKLELTWTLIPLLVSLFLFAASAAVYFRQRHSPEDAMEIHVIGKQWMWKVQHPQGKREINELHLPVGIPVKLLMTSQDVIHSFFIPAFRMKQDVLPGWLTTQWFVPTRTGSFHLFCAEYCGTDHSRMIGRVTVMSRPEYEQWLVTGEQDERPALAGARRFRELGCTGCHGGPPGLVPSPVVRAPNLSGLYGSVVPLESGKMVVADERYLRDSIMLPSSEVVHGYAPVMPSYQGRISQEDLLALIAYLKSLGKESQQEGAAR